MNAISPRKHLLALFSVFIFAIILLRTAWMCDDIYITLRTIDNFVNGYGLVYNIGERVQSYTHPLWLFLLTPFYAATRDAYYTPIFLSIILSLIAVFIFVSRVAKTHATALFGMTAFIFSKAFVDYSTSGLENPLSYLIVVVFLMFYLTSEASFESLRLLSFIAALGALNRLDLLLVFAPGLVLMLIEARATIRARPGKPVSALLLGFAPLIAWLVFSLFYYGFPWPNTAYAKLGTGVPQSLLYYQGLGYFLSSLKLDPLTLLVIGVGFTVAFLSRNRRHIAVAVGIGLYLLYIISIGGDFMSGRYFTIPFLCAVILLCTSDLFRGFRALLLALGVVLALGLTSPYSPIRSDQRYGQREETFDRRGIADERAYYFPTTGLLHACRTCKMPAHHWAQEGRAARVEYGVVQITPHVGMYGFYANRHMHLVDPLGLTDPLLARIPIPDPYKWRIGHFTRDIPPGYEETLSSGQNRIADPALAEYYNHLGLITRGNLFDFERLVDIWKMNIGQYNYLLPKARKP